MSFSQDDVAVGGQLMVGAGTPPALGLGSEKINGSAFVEGPMQVGSAQKYNGVDATLMVGETTNKEGKSALYSLWVKTFARFQKFVRVDELLKSRNIEAETIYCRSFYCPDKHFMIDHPSQKGKKLIYGCLEGPENGVYVRGKVMNRDFIDLPYYWKDLVDETTITVSLTPIGAHQDVIVKRVDSEKIYLQARPGVPIRCYFHIFATRKDIPRLEVEVDA
jgi:hypothetical protein